MTSSPGDHEYKEENDPNGVKSHLVVPAKTQASNDIGQDLTSSTEEDEKEDADEDSHGVENIKNEQIYPNAFVAQVETQDLTSSTAQEEEERSSFSSSHQDADANYVEELQHNVENLYQQLEQKEDTLHELRQQAKRSEEQGDRECKEFLTQVVNSVELPTDLSGSDLEALTAEEVLYLAVTALSHHIHNIVLENKALKQQNLDASCSVQELQDMNQSMQDQIDAFDRHFQSVKQIPRKRIWSTLWQRRSSLEPMGELLPAWGEDGFCVLYS